MPKPRPLLTTTQAALLLGCSDETVRRYCREDVLPYRTSGNRRLVARVDVERLSEAPQGQPGEVRVTLRPGQRLVVEYEGE